MAKKKKKIELNTEEVDYLTGLLEAQKSKIDLLEKKHKEKETIQKDFKTAEKIERKLAFN